jgi:hypothetical protein
VGWRFHGGNFSKKALIFPTYLPQEVDK